MSISFAAVYYRSGLSGMTRKFAHVLKDADKDVVERLVITVFNEIVLYDRQFVRRELVNHRTLAYFYDCSKSLVFVCIAQETASSENLDAFLQELSIHFHTKSNTTTLQVCVELDMELYSYSDMRSANKAALAEALKNSDSKAAAFENISFSDVNDLDEQYDESTTRTVSPRRWAMILCNAIFKILLLFCICAGIVCYLMCVVGAVLGTIAFFAFCVGNQCTDLF